MFWKLQLYPQVDSEEIKIERDVMYSELYGWVLVILMRGHRLTHPTLCPVLCSRPSCFVMRSFLRASSFTCIKCMGDLIVMLACLLCKRCMRHLFMDTKSPQVAIPAFLNLSPIVNHHWSLDLDPCKEWTKSCYQKPHLYVLWACKELAWHLFWLLQMCKWLGTGLCKSLVRWENSLVWNHVGPEVILPGERACANPNPCATVSLLLRGIGSAYRPCVT